MVPERPEMDIGQTRNSPEAAVIAGDQATVRSYPRYSFLPVRAHAPDRDGYADVNE
jgi:hypothetical protein